MNETEIRNISLTKTSMTTYGEVMKTLLTQNKKIIKSEFHYFPNTLKEETTPMGGAVIIYEAIKQQENTLETVFSKEQEDEEDEYIKEINYTPENTETNTKKYAPTYEEDAETLLEEEITEETTKEK